MPLYRRLSHLIVHDDEPPDFALPPALHNTDKQEQVKDLNRAEMLALEKQVHLNEI